MSTYRLGVVAFAVAGIAILIQAIDLFTFAAEFSSPGRADLLIQAVVLAVLAVVLFALRVPLSRRLFTDDDEPVVGPSLQDLQAVAFSVLGAAVALGGFLSFLRVSVPLAFYGDRGAQTQELLSDLVTIVVAVVLFFRGDALARLWCRTQHRDKA